MTRGAERAGKLLWIGLWLGIAYGLAEAILSCLLGFVPGALSWRSANSARVLWVAPIFYAVVGSSLGLVFGAIEAIARIDATRAMVFVALAGGAYLGARLQGEILSPLASLVLALGIAIRLSQLFTRHRERCLQLMRRSLVPLVVVVAVLAACEPALTAFREMRALASLRPAGDTPNVLVLVADTLRADHVSGYGYSRPTTPRIDRLGAEGRLFLNAYSSSSWTLPAHASLLTGRRLSEHRAGNQGRPFLDAQFPTLAEVFAKAGYATGGFVANTFWCGRQTGLSRGFIHYEDFYGNLGDAAVRTVLGRMIGYEVLPYFGFVDIPGRMRADDINGRLLHWIDGLGGRPFFAMANYLDVHGPYIPPPSYQGRFAGRPLERKSGRIAIGDVDDATNVPDRRVLKEWIDRYDESLVHLDEQIGGLADELARRKLLDRTILVFASDHGESWGEHNLLYHGHSLYLEQIRIPLLIRFPSRLAAGERDTRPVSLADVPRLVTGLAGLDDARFPSRFPIMATATDEVAVSEVGRRRGVPASWPTATASLRSLQTRQWHLIERSGAPSELYDIDADSSEATNLAQDSRFAEILAGLQKRLAQEVEPRQ